MGNQLRDLAKEKEMREKRLQEENAAAAERNRRASQAAAQKLDQLQREKEEKEQALSRTLENTRQNAEKQASALQIKIEKMRKLQELALGGVGGSPQPPAGAVPEEAAGAPSPGGGARRPSTRGRQLLYWESLKSKSKETSSMSWRGDDVFAHEMAQQRPKTAR